ncbi:HAUS augmin-like complex subunit 8, partial [Acanthisitta chloris]
LESQTFLMTYLRAKVEKNVAALEEKAEENLMVLCEEKMKLQEWICKLKREIMLKEREKRLRAELDRQVDVLTPIVALCANFKEQYENFAASLEATRHELAIKNIHIEGDKLEYLEKVQKELAVTMELLNDVLPSDPEVSTEVLNDLKELKVSSQKLNKELQRSVTGVQTLSAEVSKEVSLHNQCVCEEHHGLDVVKHWYFN